MVHATSPFRITLVCMSTLVRPSLTSGNYCVQVCLAKTGLVTFKKKDRLDCIIVLNALLVIAVTGITQPEDALPLAVSSGDQNNMTAELQTVSGSCRASDLTYCADRQPDLGGLDAPSAFEVDPACPAKCVS